MEFFEGMRKLSEQIAERKEQVRSEGQTKQSLILPFIRELGYDDGDPAEVDLEYKADMGVKGGERVDYAIKRDGKPIILIECKRLGHQLQDGDITQLFRYFNATDARIGILTNGIEYRFFSDLNKPNVMDKGPFFEFNVLKFAKPEVKLLGMFSEPLEMDTIRDWARRQKAMAGIKGVLVREFNSPSEELVDFLKRRVGQAIQEQLNSTLVKQALEELMSGHRDEVSVQPQKWGEAPRVKAGERSPSDISEPQIEGKLNPQQFEEKLSGSKDAGVRDMKIIGPRFLNVIKEILRDEVDTSTVYGKLNKRFYSIKFREGLEEKRGDRRLCRLTVQVSKMMFELFPKNYKDDKRGLKSVMHIDDLNSLRRRENADKIVKAARTYF